MRRFTSFELTSYLTGSVDPARALEFEDALAANPSLRKRLARVGERVRGLPPAPASAWRIPPPGVRRGPLDTSLAARVPLHLGGELRAGDTFSLHLDAPSHASAHLVLVLVRGADEWQVAFPTAPEDALRVKDLPTGADGTRVMEARAVVSQTEDQRWAVALVPPDVAPRWDLAPPDRWDTVTRAMRRGEVDVISIGVPTILRPQAP